ncbi:MAG: DUF4124 domain-containing protein [Proteobacteria bacterium]|nr:DUF4124 domain-containing protein [Pseudomonadota bacterium]
MSSIRYLTILILVGTYGVAQADVYRWVDEHGVPHYSDQWVAGSQVIKTSHPRPLTDSPAPPALRSGNDATSGQTPDAANTQAMQQDKRAALATQCKAAKSRYNAAITSRRIYKDGKNGEREYLSDAEADAYREQARKDVQATCGSVPVFDPNAPIPEPQPIPEPKVNPADATSP